MKKLKAFIGYFWAVLCILIIMMTFMNNTGFAKMLAAFPFMKINPVYTGGEIAQEIDHDNYKTQIHEPVFEALIGESSTGFVQVVWTSEDNLPDIIDEKIDFDNNGIDDFQITVNTTTAETSLIKLNENVISLSISSNLKNNWAVRINIKNINY